MALKEKLQKLKSFNNPDSEIKKEEYKETWKNDVEKLIHTIMDKWFEDYGKNGLMTFELVNTKRAEPYIGEYLSTSLEISLSENKFLILEPVSGVTTEYDGKLEFYMRGNINKKATIIRQINNAESPKWLIVKSYETNDIQELNQASLEKIIEEWLQ
jgi:hypothetical protein